MILQDLWFTLVTACIYCINFSAGCTNNTWGVNCSQPCGHCSSQAPQCDSVTGNCTEGCAQNEWYTGAACTTYIALCTPHDFTVLEITNTSMKVMWMCEGVTDTTLSTYQQFNFDFFFRQPKFYAISMEPIYFNFTHQGARFNGTELLEAPPFSIFYGISFSVQLKRSHYNNVQASAQVVYMTPCAAPDSPINLNFIELNRDTIGIQYNFTWQLPLYVRCEDGFVTYKLSILTVFVTRRNVIEKRTVVIETPETFADFVIPYSDRDYRVDVFAVNKQKIVSERNFTATLILRPGLPPADTDSNKELAIGLGVGLGVGICLLIVIAVLTVLLIRARRFQRESRLQASVQPKLTENPAYSRSL